MKKILRIVVLCLFWSNISLSHDLDKSKTLSLEDLLFEISSIRDQVVHVYAFFFLYKEIGKEEGLIVDPKDPERMSLSPRLQLKQGNYKRLYKDCEAYMKTIHNNRLYNNIWIPCGYWNMHLHIGSGQLFDQYIRHMIRASR